MADGVVHLPPADPSTGVKQDTGNGSLASILTKLTDTLARFGVLGANGSGLASTTNAVPVGGVDAGGTARTLLTNASGATQVGFHQGTAYSSAAAESSAVISASATRISQVRVQNLGASTRYLHLFNAASLPANGTVPKAVLTLATGASGVITFAIPTDRFSTGCVAACSTVQGTLTLSAGADFLIAADIFPASA